MTDVYEQKRRLTVKKRYDVIVAGGGVAGCAAAYSAAMRGASVLLLEKSNILGGLATLGYVNLFVPMDNGAGKQIIFGLAEKWLQMSRLVGYDSVPDEWKNGEPPENTSVHYTQRFSPYIFAFQLEEAIRSSGVDLLCDCLATEPVTEGKKIVGVVTESKSGTELYGCGIFIDTTGDADVMRRAGVPTVAGKNYDSFFGRLLTFETMKRAAESGKIEKATTGISGGGINLFGTGQPEDVPRWSGLTVEEVNDYLARQHSLMLGKLRAMPRGSADLVAIPFMPNFRTTCHIRGEYSLKPSDCYRHFDDSVCAINDFGHRYQLFEVPFRTLYSREWENLLTAGRSADATGYCWDVLRVIPPAILTGQAVGEAAVLALSGNGNVADTDVHALQKTLEKENVMIRFDDRLIPEDRTVYTGEKTPEIGEEIHN